MKKLLLCGLLTLTAAAANADVKYTTEMSMMQGGKLTPFSTTTTWLKAGLQRIDSQQNLGMYRQSESTITHCAKRQQIRFDSNLKITTSEAFAPGSTRPANVPRGHAAPQNPGKSGTGKIIMTPTIKFLGREKIAGRDTRRYSITQRIQSSGCAGNSDTTIKMEIWMADVSLPNVSCSNTPGDWKQAYNTHGSRCKITFEQRGDMKAYLAAYKGLPLKSITYDASGKPMMQMKITSISSAALNASVFNAPGNFKKVSATEYDKTRQDAMIAAMTGGGAG